MISKATFGSLQGYQGMSLSHLKSKTFGSRAGRSGFLLSLFACCFCFLQAFPTKVDGNDFEGLGRWGWLGFFCVSAGPLPRGPSQRARNADGHGGGVDTEETSRREGGGRSRASICWASFWLTLSHKLLTRNLRFFLMCR